MYVYEAWGFHGFSRGSLAGHRDSQLTHCMTQMEETQLESPAWCESVTGTMQISNLHAKTYAGKHITITCLRSLISAESRCDLYGQSLNTENN